jgi:hypothetical protein
MHLFWTNTNMIFVFVLTLEVPKNIFENIWDYVWFWKKGKHQRILCVIVLWAKVVLKMLFTCNNNKEECDINTGKHMILFHNKSSLTEKVLFKSIKQKAIKRQASFLYFGESITRLASSLNVLYRWTQRWCRTTPWPKFQFFKIHAIISAPMLDHWCFQIPQTFHC